MAITIRFEGEEIRAQSPAEVIPRLQRRGLLDRYAAALREQLEAARPHLEEPGRRSYQVASFLAAHEHMGFIWPDWVRQTIEKHLRTPERQGVDVEGWAMHALALLPSTPAESLAEVLDRLNRRAREHTDSPEWRAIEGQLYEDLTLHPRATPEIWRETLSRTQDSHVFDRLATNSLARSDRDTALRIARHASVIGRVYLARDEVCRRSAEVLGVLLQHAEVDVLRVLAEDDTLRLRDDVWPVALRTRDEVIHTIYAQSRESEHQPEVLSALLASPHEETLIMLARKAERVETILRLVRRGITRATEAVARQERWRREPQVRRALLDYGSPVALASLASDPELVADDTVRERLVAAGLYVVSTAMLRNPAVSAYPETASRLVRAVGAEGVRLIAAQPEALRSPMVRAACYEVDFAAESTRLLPYVPADEFGTFIAALARHNPGKLANAWRLAEPEQRAHVNSTISPAVSESLRTIDSATALTVAIACLDAPEPFPFSPHDLAFLLESEDRDVREGAMQLLSRTRVESQRSVRR